MAPISAICINLALSVSSSADLGAASELDGGRGVLEDGAGMDGVSFLGESAISRVADRSAAVTGWPPGELFTV